VVYAASEDDPAARKLLGRLGVEPLGDHFDPLAFHQALRLRQTAIKQVLADTGLKMPQLAMPVRVLVMGTPQTPSLDALLELMKREDVVSRLKLV
jgi:glutamyl/glutaminyl-tRNA synthetase